MRKLIRRFCRQKTVSSEKHERRVEPRREMTAVCATSFRVDNRERRALLLDLSHSGAKFGTAVEASSLTLNTGQVVEFYMSTPYGSITRRGRVVWSRPSNTISTWGVQFTEVPDVVEEPVRRLLAAA